MCHSSILSRILERMLSVGDTWWQIWPAAPSTGWHRRISSVEGELKFEDVMQHALTGCISMDTYMLQRKKNEIVHGVLYRSKYSDIMKTYKCIILILLLQDVGLFSCALEDKTAPLRCPTVHPDD